MKKKIFAAVWLISIITIALIVQFTIPVSKIFEVKKFIIEDGGGTLSITRKLQEDGFIRSSFPLLFVLFITGHWGEIRAGTFEISPDMNLIDISRVLRGGSGRLEVSVTIPEGWTLSQIADELERNGVAGRDEFMDPAKANEWRQEFSFLSDLPDDSTLEGYLFPDTYRFFVQSEPEDIVRRFLERFQEVTIGFEPSYRTVILASIVEREVSDSADRRIVADIFLKRLKGGMPLQADSTVNYVTGNKSRALSLQEKAIDSLYNTYKYYGFPPGPICNPGLEAIKAVINPNSSPYWYFLSGKDGITHFAKTLTEHERQKNLYLR